MDSLAAKLVLLSQRFSEVAAQQTALHHRMVQLIAELDALKQEAANIAKTEVRVQPQQVTAPIAIVQREVEQKELAVGIECGVGRICIRIDRVRHLEKAAIC